MKWETYEDLQAAFMASMKATAKRLEVDEPFVEDAAGMLNALIETLYLAEDDRDFDSVARTLAGLKLGYSCWLEDFRTVLTQMDLSFFDDPEREREKLKAAYRMADVFLLYLDTNSPNTVAER